MGNCAGSIVPRFSNAEIADAVSHGKRLTMEVEFNSECSFRCAYCYAGTGPTINGMSLKEWEGVLRQAKDLGCGLVVILGGEPMLYRDLFHMIGIIRGMGMEAEIFTNGTNMTAEAARRLFDLDVKVVLKFNSLDAARQDLLAGRPGANSLILKALDNLKSAGYPDKGGKLGITTVVCRQNYDELPKIWRWIREMGAYPYFEMLTPQGSASGNESLTVEPVSARILFEKLAVIDREFGFEWTPQPPLAGNECLRHCYSCVVKPDGRVYPCVGVDITVGNVREARLGDIIRESEVVNRLRNFHKYIKGPCSKCAKAERCYGCRGAAYQMTGDYLATDPMCWMHDGVIAEGDSLPAQVEKLVPHRSPMLMVDTLVSCGESTTVEAKVKPGMIFLDQHGRMEEVAFLEMIAQGMAASRGFENRHNGGVNGGYLVGAKNIHITGSASVGDNLKIILKKVFQMGDEAAVINGQVFKGADKLAEGEIIIWQKAVSTPK